MAGILPKMLNLLLLCASVTILIAHPTAEIDCTTIACCELTEEELVACSDISEKCPGYSGVGALGPEGECDSCPPGECRVGNSCVCPADFLDSKTGSNFQKLCKDEYGSQWPKSIGKENKLCVTEETDEELEEEIEEAEEALVDDEVEEAEGTVEPSAGTRFKFRREMSNVVQYIRKETGNGTNVVGMLSTGVLFISIIAAVCCLWTRRR